MKKFLWVWVMLLPVGSLAEEMAFLTVLSSPVGTFSTLETADVSQASEASRNVQFCNSTATTGNITLLNGLAPTFTQIHLGQGATLGGNVAAYNVEKIFLNQEGRVSGKQLFADKITLDAGLSTVMLVAEQLYHVNLTVQGASAAQLLDINEGASSIGPSTSSEATLKWSNQLQTDRDNATPNTTYARQYLLKS